MTVEFLVILIAILFFITLTQVVRIFQLSGKIKGYDIDKVTYSDNNINGIISIIFFVIFVVFCIYQYIEFQKFILPEASSEHGVVIDKMTNITLICIVIIFLIMNALIFYFSYKYRGREDSKVQFITHNNKLELFWTIIPAIVLTAFIIYGLNVWSQVMHPSEKALEVEIYSKQFTWTARYAGEDNILGKFHYTLVKGKNILGIDTNDTYAKDDVIIHELHLPVNEPVMLRFRSQDVIHSAYLPHFRVQMNCVPGLETSFLFTPTKTTESMRNNLKDESFDYVLLCNKICGAAHYNMQMKVIVESKEDYNKWIKNQTKFKEVKL